MKDRNVTAKGSIATTVIAQTGELAGRVPPMNSGMLATTAITIDNDAPRVKNRLVPVMTAVGDDRSTWDQMRRSSKKFAQVATDPVTTKAPQCKAFDPVHIMNVSVRNATK